jgi:uncharacterized protein (TIGR03435 family)
MSRAIAGSVLAVWLCSLAYAQSVANAKPAEAKVAFEAASVKPSPLSAAKGVIRPGLRGGPGSGDPGRVTCTFSTIRDLMADAYSVKRSQISGGPGWLDSERFDIVAKVPAGATKEQVKLMLQSLLEERFQLTLHRQTKEQAVYALVVGAKGPKLKDSTVTAESGAQAAPPPLPPRLRGMKIGPDGCPDVSPGAAARPGNFRMMTPNGECLISRGQTMDDLAAQLSSGFDRPVIDRTGLKGRYDWKLRYDPATMPGGRGGPKDALDPPPDGADPANRMSQGADPPPGIFNALQEQLGLKLEAGKGPVDLLVIDHVRKTPAQN